jgi:hypothetical protein
MKKYLHLVFPVFALLQFTVQSKLYGQTAGVTPKQRLVVKIDVPPDKFCLFLLAGQSNMAGRGEVTPADTIGNPHILRLNRDGEWEMAKDPIHFDKDVAGVGPGMAFAKEMLRHDTTMVIGLIPCAAGGSSVDNWLFDKYWEQTQSYPWNNALLRTRLAMKSGTLTGILWHQGEADATTEKLVDYEEKLIRLVQKFRNAFGQPNLPFIAGELPEFNKSAIFFDQVPTVYISPAPRSKYSEKDTPQR